MRYHSFSPLTVPVFYRVSFFSHMILSDLYFFQTRSCLVLVCDVHCRSYYYSYIVSLIIFVFLILYYEHCGLVGMVGPNCQCVTI